MLYRTLLKLIERGMTDGLADKIDIFFAASKLTEEEYTHLAQQLGEESKVHEYTNLVTAAMSLVGTLVGTFGGIMVSNRLSNYRIGQLEEKVAKHNNLVERTYKLEGEMQEAQHDILDLKEYHKGGNR